MFNNLQNMMQQVLGGNADPQAIEQAATDHVSAMDPDELSGHMQTAADNLNQNGQRDLSAQVAGLVSQNQSNPQGIKDAAISLIKNNPQVLAHFAPPFAQGLLGRMAL